ncbi:amino acid adenylation domain-containing protein [Ancylomarina sp. DW003]|nr:amino acid adenylation domain-containing protein [Ancylomarina sp. DW003]MDE5422996.1 amino acid adenylation domain-containing protein [Ancylomarina sp. DW003]
MHRHNLLTQILKGIQNHQNRNAFFIDGKNYTYKVLAERISGILKEIRHNTGKYPQCIGIVEKDDIETYASLIAVLLSGNTYVILNPHNPEDRNYTIIESTDIQLILQSDKSIISIEYPKHIKTIYTQSLSSSTALNELYKIPEENDNAYIIFTSGSTGVPKGVPITHRNLNSFYSAYSDLNFELDKNDRMLQMFDLCFDVSVVSTLYPLTLGACIYTVPQDGVKYTHVYELLEDEDLTFAAIAPSLLSYLQPYFEEIQLPKLKYLILTAEASNWDLLSQFTACTPNAEYINLYGPTEGTIYCTAYRVNPNQIDTYNGMLAIGQAFKNMHAIIVDDNLKEVTQGEKGELCIAGSQLMNGYWKDVNKTNEVFVNLDCFGVTTRYYKTGDICFVDDKKCIHYCGRKDYQVQIQGFRVELNEIEHTVRQYHSKGSNVVVAKPNQLGNQELHLFLEKYEGNDSNLFEYLKEKLPIYMCPKKIYEISELPLNTSGKVDRKKLLQLI